ncbi:MAG: AraC family transcriptional regulator [Bacteroidaceae bacterium]|nr:AraC family transcriptional regulator [Bacteroidaceae bacterium]
MNCTIKYLLNHDTESRWGLSINTIGTQDIAAGSAYPAGDHPEDYLFSPEKGRVLREAQIVYITKGGGWFESLHQPRTKLRAGDAVVLYPHEWHSYAPDPETGWSEAWIGFTGEEAGNLLRKFFPDKSRPIFHVGLCDTLFSAYEQAYDAAEKMLPAYQQQLIGYVGLIIATVYARSLQLPYLDNPDMTSINLAIKYMRQHVSSNIRMEDVAAQAGIGYSKFRKVFKDYTGFAPGQYFLRLKMERAKDYLLGTDLSCKEITYRLGFDSASHFNKMFRLYEGVTPAEFRKA